MNRLPIFIIGLILFCAFGCESKHKVEESDLVTKYRDTLVGCFNGVEIDTLIAEPTDSLSISAYEGDPFGGQHYNWRIYTKNNTVKELRLEGFTIGINFIKEGDLDGNNTEEWGFIPDWVTSTWRSYHVYTYINGEWQLLFEPQSIWLGHLDIDSRWKYTTEEDIVQSDNKDFVKVKLSDIRNDGDDFVLIDTLIRIIQYPN